MTISQFLNSGPGRKAVMALTGLFLCLFLIEHLYGNLLLFFNDGGQAFIEYSHDAVRNILIRIIEVVLFVAIIMHVSMAIRQTKKNSDARPIKYAVYKVNETSSWFSRNMGLTGSVILFFLVIHLYSFFVPYRIKGLEEGENIAHMVKAAFENGWYVLIYVISCLLLAFHLNHGFQSAFRSLGLHSKKHEKLLMISGTVFAYVIVFVGFASIPVLFYFGIAGNTF